MDISAEIQFKTARSGGKGGQNVNKVESMVTGYWDIGASQLLTPEEKSRLLSKLQHRITRDGLLLVKSQEARTQLENKQTVVAKMHALVAKSLHTPKPRKATKPGKAAREARLLEKKQRSERKATRQKATWE